MRRLALALLCALGAGVLWVPPASAVPADQPAAGEVLHRVVWDGAVKKGISIFSAEIDGTDRRHVFHRARGFIVALTLNPAGTEVAFAPAMPRDVRAPLVVADVMGEREPVNVLAGVKRFYAVGAVGWSPNGRRLVFDGFTTRGEDRYRELWTVTRTGHGLRRLAVIEALDDDSWLGDRTLPWTREGIFYSDVAGLHRVSGRKDRVVLSKVRGAVVSGNGSWLYVHRLHGANSDLWRLHPDGSGLQRVIRGLRPHAGRWYLPSSIPSYDGNTLLTTAIDTAPAEPSNYYAVVHEGTRAPTPTDPVLTFVDQPFAIAWN